MFLSRTQHALPQYGAGSRSVASNSGELDVSFETGASSSASDGRMGYGAFNDDLKTSERVRTTSVSLAPPRSSLKASPPSLFPSFADFVRVPLSSQLGSTGGNKGWIRSEDECGSRALKTPDCSRNSNTEGRPEAPSPLVGLRTHSYPKRDSDFTFNPFDTPDEVLEARRSDSHLSHPPASGPFTSSAPSYTAPLATRARNSTPQSTNCYAQQAEYSYPLPVTPPHTPFRSASMPLHQAPHPPHAMHSLPPSPPPSHPPHFYPSLPRQRTYPLSQVEAEAVAHAHNGRVPSLLQLAPPSDSDHAPIINTGNQGPMIVQQGDWSCGVCGFVNWRRRKICLRCFPYANDIGNILTINSQRAASLAISAAPPRPISNGFADPCAPASPHPQTGYPQRQYCHRDDQQQHTFPPPFQHVRPSLSSGQQPAPPQLAVRPPLTHHTNAPARICSQSTERYTSIRNEAQMPEVIWTSPRPGEGRGDEVLHSRREFGCG